MHLCQIRAKHLWLHRVAYSAIPFGSLWNIFPVEILEHRIFITVTKKVVLHQHSICNFVYKCSGNFLFFLSEVRCHDIISLYRFVCLIFSFTSSQVQVWLIALSPAWSTKILGYHYKYTLLIYATVKKLWYTALFQNGLFLSVLIVTQSAVYAFCGRK